MHQSLVEYKQSVCGIWMKWMNFGTCIVVGEVEQQDDSVKVKCIVL